MSYTYYEYLVPLQPDSNLTLDNLAAKLKEDYAKITRVKAKISHTANRLTLKIGTRYSFTVHYETTEWVPSECQELARDYPDYPHKEAVAQCKTRLSTYGESDPDMKYFNDSLTLLDAIQSFEGVHLFDPHSGFKIKKSYKF